MLQTDNGLHAESLPLLPFGLSLVLGWCWNDSFTLVTTSVRLHIAFHTLNTLWKKNKTQACVCIENKLQIAVLQCAASLDYH